MLEFFVLTGSWPTAMSCPRLLCMELTTGDGGVSFTHRSGQLCKRGGPVTSGFAPVTGVLVLAL